MRPSSNFRGPPSFFGEGPAFREGPGRAGYGQRHPGYGYEAPRSSGPVRTGDPERDWYFEGRRPHATRGADGGRSDASASRMDWRAAGAQDLPGGAMGTLLEIHGRRAAPDGDSQSHREQSHRGQSHHGQSRYGQSHYGQSHYGKGPRNYQRSDGLLLELICEQLTENPQIDAVDVSVDVANGEVTLTGTVAARDQKRWIEDFVADVRGVTEVHNMLAIRTDEIENRMSGL